jgi:hypothetical protein
MPECYAKHRLKNRKRNKPLILLMIFKVVPTTGFEPINMVFSPLPTLASFSVFIAHKVTNKFNDFKHYMCICGKSREENHVQIVCK